MFENRAIEQKVVLGSNDTDEEADLKGRKDRRYTDE